MWHCLEMSPQKCQKKAALKAKRERVSYSFLEQVAKLLRFGAKFVVVMLMLQWFFAHLFLPLLSKIYFNVTDTIYLTTTTTATTKKAASNCLYDTHSAVPIGY